MKTRLTIKQMVKEILFDATAGRRTADNYVDGMTVIDSMQTFYYRAYFEDKYQRWLDGELSSKAILTKWAADLRERGRMGYEKPAFVSRCIDRLLHA